MSSASQKKMLMNISLTKMTKFLAMRLTTWSPMSTWLTLWTMSWPMRRPTTMSILSSPSCKSLRSLPTWRMSTRRLGTLPPAQVALCLGGWVGWQHFAVWSPGRRQKRFPQVLMIFLWHNAHCRSTSRRPKVLDLVPTSLTSSTTSPMTSSSWSSSSPLSSLPIRLHWFLDGIRATASFCGGELSELSALSDCWRRRRKNSTQGMKPWKRWHSNSAENLQRLPISTNISKIYEVISPMPNQSFCTPYSRSGPKQTDCNGTFWLWSKATSRRTSRWWRLSDTSGLSKTQFLSMRGFAPVACVWWTGPTTSSSTTSTDITAMVRSLWRTEGRCGTPMEDATTSTTPLFESCGLVKPVPRMWWRPTSGMRTAWRCTMPWLDGWCLLSSSTPPMRTTRCFLWFLEQLLLLAALTPLLQLADLALGRPC